MNFLDKIKLKVGVTERNDFDLSSDHLTTSDFFRISPVLAIPTVPGGKYNIKASTFTRLSPMTNPVLGRCTIHNRAFFVPFPVIMNCWNAFISDSPYSDASIQNTIPSKVTTFMGSEVARLFTTSGYSQNAGSGAPDFIDYTSGTAVSKQFTALGRRCWNILCSLGYKVPLSGASMALQSTPNTQYDVEYSALPLLAFFKVYKDWYANQAYNNADYDEVFYRVNGTLNNQDLDNIFGIINLAMYDKDYFTAASDNPVMPNSSTSSSYTIQDITNDSTGGNSSVVRATNPATSLRTTTPSIANPNTGNAYPQNLTQFALDSLKALTDFLKRNNLVGSRAADRMLARFGVRPSDAELRMSIPFGSDETLVQISDVMATATGSATASGSTQTSLLGDYAGKGIGFGQGGFYYECNDYGMILVVSTIIPKIGYVNGTTRFNTMYKNRLDFFTPEFDGKSGVQAIRMDELKSDYIIQPPVSFVPDQPISFIPRWADLKLGKDNMTGDFTIGSRRSGLDTWHMFRIFSDSANYAALRHTLNFTRGEQSQYDRIFAYTGTDYDHFILIYNFNVKASLPMSRVFDTYKFDGGRDITLEVNGAQFN